VAALLRERKQTADSREDPFTIRGLEEISAAATQTSRTMTLLLGSIAAVSLLVGGIGIMNIMLVSVTERTREIGLRLAVGARQRDIRLQFVVEALLLATLGGVLGVLGGIATATAIARGLGWPTLVSAEAIVSALLVSAAVGIFFGWYPAGKAARLNPIDALRHE
jgi:ABC-type antimicrobial peptide transport system, permease component